MPRPNNNIAFYLGDTNASNLARRVERERCRRDSRRENEPDSFVFEGRRNSKARWRLASLFGGFSADDVKQWRNTRSRLTTLAYLVLTLASAIEMETVYVLSPSLAHSSACHDRDFPRISPSESSRVPRTRRLMTAGGARVSSLPPSGRMPRKEIGLISRVVPDVNDDFSLARLDEKSFSEIRDARQQAVSN